MGSCTERRRRTLSGTQEGGHTTHTTYYTQCTEYFYRGYEYFYCSKDESKLTVQESWCRLGWKVPSVNTPELHESTSQTWLLTGGGQDYIHYILHHRNTTEMLIMCRYLQLVVPVDCLFIPVHMIMRRECLSADNLSDHLSWFYWLRVYAGS